ncbi:MAG: hypothetical protein IPJ89_01585 [Candidatus Iainarchaeum archaeon]|uniref:Terpene cyclase/mutase family protein n=1 Tax=Candidatus Iainarchaeum sp. TaxID=3101447 RepID=A0A7T9DKC0_9ARCH|nr:MAG: hypothetical protein IPJ89_01585 [Candidatus Diapherotrites archaeon]
MNKEKLAIGLGLAILLFAGFGVHAQLVANEQLQNAINNGVAFLDSQSNYDATDIAVLAVLDGVAPSYQFKQKAIQRVDQLDENHTFWRKWLLDEPINLNELTPFEVNLKYNLMYAKALTCTDLSNETIQSLANLVDNPQEEFGNYNNEHAILILQLYNQCPNASVFSTVISNTLNQQKHAILSQASSSSLDEQLERYCVLGLAGQQLTQSQLNEILLLQQVDGGWSTDYDLSKSTTYVHPTALALCALIKSQQNGVLP